MVWFDKVIAKLTRSSAVAETVWRFVSLNILLSHSRPFKMTLLR